MIVLASTYLVGNLLSTEAMLFICTVDYSNDLVGYSVYLLKQWTCTQTFQGRLCGNTLRWVITVLTICAVVWRSALNWTGLRFHLLVTDTAGNLSIAVFLSLILQVSCAFKTSDRAWLSIQFKQTRKLAMIWIWSRTNLLPDIRLKTW